MKVLLSLLYLALAFFFLIFPQYSRSAANLSLLSVKSVAVAALFPMMVLSRLVASRFSPIISKLLKGRTAWERLNLSDGLLPSVFPSLLTGIPMGAMEAERLLSEKKISCSEAKKAVVLLSAPSPVFVISVVADSFTQGVVYLAVIWGINYLTAFFIPTKKTLGNSEEKGCKFNEALSQASTAALSVSANIIFFTALSFTLSGVLGIPTLYTSILLEMGSGVIAAAQYPVLKLVCLGFSGISALSQIKSVAPHTDMTPLVVSRVVCAAVLPLFYHLTRTIF